MWEGLEGICASGIGSKRAFCVVANSPRFQSTAVAIPAYPPGALPSCPPPRLLSRAPFGFAAGASSLSSLSALLSAWRGVCARPPAWSVSDHNNRRFESAPRGLAGRRRRPAPAAAAKWTARRCASWRTTLRQLAFRYALLGEALKRMGHRTAARGTATAQQQSCVCARLPARSQVDTARPPSETPWGSLFHGSYTTEHGADAASALVCNAGMSRCSFHNLRSLLTGLLRGAPGARA